jgi:hypothetical protein
VSGACGHATRHPGPVAWRHSNASHADQVRVQYHVLPVQGLRCRRGGHRACTRRNEDRRQPGANHLSHQWPRLCRLCWSLQLIRTAVDQLTGGSKTGRTMQTRDLIVTLQRRRTVVTTIRAQIAKGRCTCLPEVAMPYAGRGISCARLRQFLAPAPSGAAFQDRPQPSPSPATP